MIDSHCHLADPKFAEDVSAVVARAVEAGVGRMVTIGDSLEESKRGVGIAEQFENVFCTVGVHPHVSKEWHEGDAQRLRTLAGSSKKVRAIGEIGLDYHYDFSPRDVQRAVFQEQLQIAKELQLPVVVHCRSAPHQSLLSDAGRAVDDVWTIVDEIKPEKLVVHCCTEQWDDVRRFVERGYLLSFTGIATYPNAGVIRDTIKQCPLDQLMVETDAPYLAPVPHRGKRNEPAFVVDVAKIVAEIKGLSISQIDAETAKNAVRFYSLP